MKKIFLHLIRGIVLIYPLLLHSQTPVSEFTANITKGCSPLVVSFTDLSTNTPSSWNWNFGDAGANSTVQHPSRVYINPGFYTVTLIATNANGSDTETKTAYITVFANPVANFSSNVTTGCDAASVIFADNSTEGDTNIVAWQWDFGDGNNSSTQNPTHNYTSSGNYTVTLKVTDANGCAHTAPKTNYITVNTTPVSAFSGTPLAKCTPPLSVSFTNTSTGTGSLTYSWTFGDGNISAAQNPSNNYAAAGKFDVTLIVTDPIACADTLFLNDYVVVENLVTAFSASPVTGCEGLNVQFTDLTSSNPNSWSWTFGDGNVSAAQNPSNTYTAPGSYTVKLVSGNAVGCKDSVIFSNLITIKQKPTANFSADTTSACKVPLTVKFTDSSVPNSGSIISWSWNFGDGNTSSLQNPTHIYTTTGSFTATLTVMNSDSCSNSFVRSSYINIIPPNAGFSADKTMGCAPFVTNFTDLSSASLNDIITSWNWNFGDGNTSALTNPSNTYADSGNFPVTLIIQTQFGCADTAFGLVEAGIKPTAGFSETPDSGCYPLTVQFTNLSSSFVDEWRWNFGDLITSGLTSPEHTFQGIGYFTVELIVGFNGCYDTLRKDSAILVYPPVTGFTASPRIGCFDSVTVSFNDTSFGANKWKWFFGDGATDTVADPTHTYESAGYWDVTLIAIDTLSGCADTLLDTSYVVLDSLVLKNGATPDSGCRQLAVSFTDSSSSLTPFVGWKWFFGDGDSSSSQNPAHTYKDTGLFNVTLIATDNLGCTDTLLKNDFINVRGIYSTFSADTTFGCTPLIVGFLDSSGGTSPAISWVWNYGDGSKIDTFFVSTNPTHTYNLPGIYTVTLTVRDTIDKCTYTNPLTIIPTYPFPKFNANDTTPCQNEVVTFSTSGTSAANPVFFWNFGDGFLDTTTAANITYSYDNDSAYAVTLTVVDSNGCDSILFFTDYIKVDDPVARYTADKTSDCYPLFVAFTDTSYGNITGWSWSFGDGQPLSSDNDPSHAYNYPGLYDVRLIITDNKGCIDTSLKPAYIEALGPVGSFVFNNDSGCVPYPVTFTPTSINTDSYTWDFRDGIVGTITDSIYTHSYDSGGVFAPILILNDTINATKICKIIATPPVPDSIYVDYLVPDFTPSDTTLCNPGKISFIDKTSTLFSLTGWNWSFGNDSTSILQNPTVTYMDTGTYTIILSSTSSLGCSRSDTDAATIYIPPVLLFSPSDFDICIPDVVTFNNNSTVISKIISWLWNFGDGDTATSQSPSHEYTQSGIYTVNLTVKYGDTICSSTFTSPTQINAYDPPIAGFSIGDTITGQEMLTVTFINESFVNNLIGPHNYIWNFGDIINNASTEISPTHLYIKAGTFNVQLIVTNAGCSDTVNNTITVRNTEEFEVPNIFTPRPITEGINDVFFIDGLLPNSKLIIFNRWGQILYENNNYQNNWDGGDNPGDVYYYILTNDSDKRHGYFRIIR